MRAHDIADRKAALNQLTLVQEGLVTAAQLRELGFDNGSVTHRVAASGIWRRVLPGIYVTHAGAPTKQRRLAALLYGGAESMLTAHVALALHGSRVAARHEKTSAHLLVPHHRQRSSTGFVVVERTTRWPNAVVRDGLPVAPAARAALDATRRMGDLNDVRAVLSDAVQCGLTTLGELRRELQESQRRGTRLPRLALASLDAGTRSAPEAALRDAWLNSSLREPLWNVDLRTKDGTFIARPDAYVREVGLAVEVESREFHFAEADWRRTMARQARMSTHGVVVLQFPPSRIASDADEVMSEIRATVSSLAGRPLPHVCVHPGR